LIVGLIGCQKSETISTYDAPRTEPPPRAVDVEAERKSLDHMFAAIVPQKDKAWFFKLVAPDEDAANELRKPFAEFVSSITLGEGDATPTWKLPAGWMQKPGDRMRTATIEVPHGGAKLELAVSTLPLSEDWDPFVERNVNRWMGQLQQGALSTATVAKLSKKAPIQGGVDATTFELVGFMKAAPMAGMPAGHPPVGEGMKAATAGSPRASDKTDRPEAGPAVEPAEFTYKAPEGWQRGATGPVRKASFNVSDGSQTAEVAVTAFNASGGMADPIGQAERWAGQVGLKLSAADLKAAGKEATIDGKKGQQFELLGQGDGAKAILAAMVERDGMMWFFKMTGDRPLVEKQREAFAKFVESVHFKGPGK
jgi:hypothetical protein